MRMAKRIAVGILTAAMALSLLTACGGGEAPAPSENPGNGSGTSSGETTGGEQKPEQKPEEKPAEKPKDDDLNGLEDGSEIAFNKSRSYKLLQQVQSTNRLYMKTETTAQGQTVYAETAQVSADGVTKVYSNYTSKGQTGEMLTVTAGKQTTSYQLFSKQKMAWKQDVKSGDSGNSSTDLNRFTYTVKKTTRVINAVPYYAEEVTGTDQQSKQTETMILCYDNTNTLVYIIEEPGTPNELVIHVLVFSSAIPDSVTLNVPNDWEVYTFVYDENNRLEKITAPDGHELTNEERSQLFQRASS